MFSLLSHCVKTSISEFPTYASFGGGGSHIVKQQVEQYLKKIMMGEVEGSGRGQAGGLESPLKVGKLGEFSRT